MTDPLDDAERRRLQRLAYGPGATDGQRAQAISVLADAADALRAQQRSVAAPAETSSPEGSDAEPSMVESASSGEAAEDDDALADRGPGRRRRRLLITSAAVVAALVLTGVVANLIPRSPVEVLETTQSERDRETPAWLDGALYTAASAMKDDSLYDGLRDSMRRVGAEELGAYLFRDRESNTYCLAVAKRLDCAEGEDFAQNGLEIEARAEGADGLRYTFTGDLGLRTEPIEAADGNEYHSGWSTRFEECVTESGFTVIATPYGLVVPRAVPPDRRLEFALSVADCAYRYPDVAAYVGWASSGTA